jgi:uncharacterized membrane protein YdjX (TVP38/TMEM64 family)
MLIYSALVTIYLSYLGFTGEAKGIHLWPAVLVHLILTVLLALQVARKQRSPRQSPI